MADVKSAFVLITWGGITGVALTGEKCNYMAYEMINISVVYIGWITSVVKIVSSAQ